MLSDLRYALRTLARSRGFAFVAILSLALGIGANTAIFSLLDQVLLKSLPVADPERLVVFHISDRLPGSSSADNNESVFSYPMYRDFASRNEVFSGVIARGGTEVTVRRASDSELASADLVTGNFFDVLGVRPAVGRLLTAADDGEPSAHPVVVLGYGYWQRRFGGNSAVVGQTIGINGHQMTVLGVTSPSFRGVISGQVPDLYAPMAMKREITPTWDGMKDRRVMWLSVFARLKPGVAMQRAETAMAPLFHSILEDEAAQMGPARSPRARAAFLATKLNVLPAAQGVNALRGDLELPLMALMAMVGLVLLIACANVANLLIARAAGRQREIAIRLAIGASRWTLMRQMMVESILLAVCGGALGILVAHWTVDALIQAVPTGESGTWFTNALDARVLGFNAALSLVTGIVFGLLPALRATRPNVGPALRETAGTSRASRGQAAIRKTMVVAQVCLSLVLLIGAGLFARSLANLMNFDPGFRTENLMTFSVNPRLNGYTAERTIVFAADLQRRLENSPGVTSVGAANLPALANSNQGSNITVEGYHAGTDDEVGTQRKGVTPGYFKTMGIPVIAGRELTERDATSAPKVVLVNQMFVDRYFGGRVMDAVGKHMTFGAGTVKLDREIVGVVRNNKHRDIRSKDEPFTYTAYAQDDRPARLTYYVRSARDEQAIAGQVRSIMRELDGSLAVFEMHSMKAQLEQSIVTDRLIAILSIAFGGLATVLAAIGLYGVIAYVVARRTNEIGVRMALGASRGSILMLVLREVGFMLGAGVVIGVPAAYALSRVIESALFGLKAGDPVVFVGATVLLVGIGLAAGFVPAQRAARVDPIRALRWE